MDNKILKIVYTFFLGLMLALFIGLGISTFYPAPKMPQYPHVTWAEKEPPAPNEAEQRKYEENYRIYEQASKAYNRNVVIIALAASIVLMTISLLLEKITAVLANGVLLGGLFTLLYSIARSFAADDSRFSFAAVTVGLIVALYLGYHRFVATGPTPKK